MPACHGGRTGHLPRTAPGTVGSWGSWDGSAPPQQQHRGMARHSHVGSLSHATPCPLFARCSALLQPGSISPTLTGTASGGAAVPPKCPAPCQDGGGREKPTHRFFGSASRFSPWCDCSFLRPKKNPKKDILVRPVPSPRPQDAARGADGIPLPPTHDCQIHHPSGISRATAPWWPQGHPPPVPLPAGSQPQNSPSPVTHRRAQDVSRLFYKQVYRGCPHGDTRCPWLSPHLPRGPAPRTPPPSGSSALNCV